jgi:hypothetical protein
MKLGTTYEDLMEYEWKYQFHYNSENKMIICTTTYKGQTIRGVAKCGPDDEFNMAIGKKLAYLRCRQKFAKKKLKRALKAHEDAVKVEAKAKNNLYKATEFVNDSDCQLETATDELTNFERELGI